MSIKNKKKVFKKKTTLNKKILFPFIIVIIVLAVSSTIVSVVAVSELIQSQLHKRLELENKFIQTQFSRIIDTVKIYTKGTQYYRYPERIIDSIEPNQELINKEHFSMYQDLEFLDPEHREKLTDFLENNDEKETVKLHFRGVADHPEFQLAYHLKNTYHAGNRVLSSLFTFDQNFLPFFQIDEQTQVVLIFSDHDNTLHTVSNAKLLKERPQLVQLIKQNFRKNSKASFPYLSAFNVQNTTYSFVINSFEQFPNLYYLCFVTSNQAFYYKVKLILLSMAVLLGIIAVIFIIYALIIKKITSSIDILSAVSEKVAKGDLDQQIFCDSSDEIGELSSIFNQMVTNLKLSAQDLLEEKERSEAIISCIPEGIIVTDMDNRLILANTKAEDMFNFQSNQVQGKVLLEYLNNTDLISVLKKKFKDQHVIQSDVEIKGKDGNPNIFSLTSSLVCRKDDTPIGVITVLRDMTYEKQIEELREGFLRTVSHELRTPLTSVIGFIEVVQTGSTGAITEEQSSYLRTALNEAKNLKTLIDDLLDLSQFKAGKSKMTYTNINAKELVEAVTTSLSPLAKGKNLALRSTVNDNNIFFKGDNAKLRRVLLNLVSNSIKFTQTGSIEISVKTTEDNTITFSVTDTGIGIKDNEKEVIFEKFRQIDYSSTRQYEGIGLGLTIVKELVEMHNGSIHVESEFGKGSTFSFTLPKSLKS